MKKITVYILTHKKFYEKYDNQLYKPLLNGSYFLQNNFNYLTDNTGDNISKLNPYYAELTGEYWVWKNSDADIIGFNHYRRWFVKNLKFDKLTRNDIITDLQNNDIILPQKSRLENTITDTIKKGMEINPNYGAKWEDYLKLEKIIKKNFPRYYNDYKKIMNGKECYSNNMFICDKKLADKYFTWLFDILNLLKTEIDFSQYSENNKRVFGFFSEILLTVFVEHENLKIKEHYIYFLGRKMPHLHILIRRFPNIGVLERVISEKIIKKSK